MVLRRNGRVMHFAFRTGPALDGLDFRTAGGQCLRFRVLLEGAEFQHVVVGRRSRALRSARLELCR